MDLSQKELQYFTHKLTNMLSFNKEDIEEIKKMNKKELLILIIVLNDMYEYIIKTLEEHFIK